MKHYKSLRDAFSVCYGIGSPVRLEILEQIQEHKLINLDTLAKNLHLTNGALTKHICMLEKVGIIKVSVTKGKRGFQKQCSIKEDKILIDITTDAVEENCEINELPLGLYSDFKIDGHCGVIMQSGYIGSRDDCASFLSPLRSNAAALWFQSGYLTYMLPPLKNLSGDELRFVFEISPDIIGGNEVKSGKVSFSLDNINLGKCEITSNSSARRGFLNPAWYDSFLPQFGSLKTLRINSAGTFLDGEKISAVTRASFTSPRLLKLETDDGIMLFGKDFGDYNSSIKYCNQHN